eukprot:scaffold1960_cov332-Prasinococcus_capsulatus_cf.AAC.5
MATATATPTPPPAANGTTPAPAPPPAAAAAAAAAASTTAPAGASSSLYVGDLEPTISEAQLYDIFSTIGPVVSIRVCRDLVTRRSLGYAYVNYNNSVDAARALEVLNFTNVGNKPMRIMYSHRDPSLRKSGVGNIFIKNLDKSIDNKALYDTFSAFGPVLSCKVKTDEQGNSLGHGFVQYESAEAAQQAIDKVNGMLLNDQQVTVAHFVRKSERQKDAENKYTNVFFKNISEEATEEDVQKEFEAYGTVKSVAIMKDEAGKSKCFGFADFEEPEAAQKAVDELNGKSIAGKEWYVGRAQKKAERQAELKAKFEAERKERLDKLQGVNLYLKNLDDQVVDDSKLRELFAEFGTITSCLIMRDAQGQSKGSGFVAFSTPEEATRAVTEMNGKMVGAKPLYVALAQRKEERQQRLKTQFSNRIQQGGTVPSVPPMFPPPMGQAQMFYGQPPPGVMGMGYPPQQMMMRPGMPYQQMMPVQGAQAGVPRQGGGRGRRNQQGQQGSMGRGAGGNRGMRYATNARGPVPGVEPLPVVAQAPPAAAAAAAAAATGAQDAAAAQGGTPALGLAQLLAQANPDQQRMMLGEALYPLVEQLEPATAGKVTGMLLEMDQSEVLHLIESPDALRAKVQEAMTVLQQAAAQAAQQQQTTVEEQLTNLNIA